MEEIPAPVIPSGCLGFLTINSTTADSCHTSVDFMVPKFVPFGWTEILLSVSPAQPPLLAKPHVNFNLVDFVATTQTVSWWDCCWKAPKQRKGVDRRYDLWKIPPLQDANHHQDHLDF